MFRDIISEKVIIYLAAVAVTFLTSGGIYLFVMQPGAVVSTSTGTGMAFLVQSSMSMTSTECFATFFLTLAGMAGFFLLNKSLQKSFDINSSKMKYLVAVALVILAIGIMEIMAYLKFN